MMQVMESRNMRGNWQQFRREAQNRWGKLTDRDLDMLGTSVEDMVSTMQKRYKYSRRRAEKEVRRFARQYTTTIEDVREGMEDTVERAQNTTQQSLRRARRTIARRPMPAVLGAMMLGLALGLSVIPIRSLRK
jgi:uncharacterized protein YjbJ (UPF0337 family)